VAGVFRAEPVLGKARVGDVTARLDRVQVRVVGGEPAAELRLPADVAVAGNDDRDPGYAREHAKALPVAAERVGRLQVEQRDLQVGKHVARDQHAAVGEEDGTVARGVGVVLVDQGARARPVDLVADHRLDRAEAGQVVAGRALLHVA
jgi:hypothetical protein